MPVKVEEIKEALLNDPDFEAFPGKTKEESAWATAWGKFRQMRKNEEALSLAKQYSDDPNKGATAMPFPIGEPTTLENTHSDKKVRMKASDSNRRNELGQTPIHPLARMEALTKYLQDTYNFDIEKDYPPPGPPPRPGLVWRQETARWVRPGTSGRSVEADAIRARQKLESERIDFNPMYPYGAPKSPIGSKAAEREVERNIQGAINVAGAKEREVENRRQLLGRIREIERQKNLEHYSGLQLLTEKGLEKLIHEMEKKMETQKTNGIEIKKDHFSDYWKLRASGQFGKKTPKPEYGETLKLPKSKRIKKQVRSPFAVATSTAKKMGFKRFTEGSPGREKRGEIAEALKRGSRKSLDSFLDWLQKE